MPGNSQTEVLERIPVILHNRRERRNWRRRRPAVAARIGLPGDGVRLQCARRICDKVLKALGILIGLRSGEYAAVTQRRADGFDGLFHPSPL